MCVAEFVSIAKDVVVGIAALVGAVVAVLGLGTWKRQIKGQSDYDLARRLLVTVFKYRDAVDGVRHPAMWADEMPLPSAEESERMSREQSRFYGVSRAYQSRWEKVQVERASLYADTLVAEALWGDELKRLFKDLYSLEHELLACIRLYLDAINPDIPDDTKDATAEIRKKRRDIMYDDLSEDGDEYRKQFRSKVEAVEKYLKSKLGH